jgi:hypothetical protein
VQLAVILGLTLFVITWVFAALKGLFNRFVGGDHEAFENCEAQLTVDTIARLVASKLERERPRAQPSIGNAHAVPGAVFSLVLATSGQPNGVPARFPVFQRLPLR